MIDPIDYEYINEKYGKLIEYVANKIGGDQSLDRDDYSQAIWQIVIDYLPRYLVKTNCKTAEEFCIKYPKHVKQWIWTAKNHIGGENTKKASVKRHESLEYILELSETFNKNEDYIRKNELLNHADKFIEKLAIDDDPSIYATIKSIANGKDLNSKILHTLLTDPNSVKNNGAVNMSAISRALGVPLARVISAFKEIKKEYNYES